MLQLNKTKPNTTTIIAQWLRHTIMDPETQT
jgi:hypothetical protein